MHSWPEAMSTAHVTVRNMRWHEEGKKGYLGKIKPGQEDRDQAEERIKDYNIDESQVAPMVWVLFLLLLLPHEKS